MVFVSRRLRPPFLSQALTFWRAKSVRPIQTILGTAEQIRREVIPVGFGFADGLEQLPPLFAGTLCAVG